MERIQLGHGSGGRLMQELIKNIIQPAFEITELSDSAVLSNPLLFKENTSCRLAYSTDSYVVSPIFFPGGNIGDLAINGTVNDLSVVGAMPLYISAGIILEEGFPLEDLKKIISSMSDAAKNAGVRIVTGDTKVAEKGKADGIFINTSGIGVIPYDVQFNPALIRPGDKIIISGLIGNHGIAVLSKRHGLSFEPPVLSDTAPLNKLVQKMLKYKNYIKIMRDPTRGGIAAALNEIANDSGYSFILYEDLIPYLESVKGACELLGIDILNVANEGILIAIVSPEITEQLLETMKFCDIATHATIIGEVSENDHKLKGSVILKTSIGGKRIINMPLGEQLPRIC